MKTITQVLQKTGQEKSNSLSNALQRKNETLLRTYGKRENFMMTFNPDAQKELCHNPDLCHFGNFPTLSQLNAAYGRNTAVMWLTPQLYNLSEYCGVRDKLQGRPLEECAGIIATEFHWLKITEVMLFLHRFKSGRYGRFYGSVDPLVITTALRTFISERGEAYFRHEQKERELRMASQPKAITWEEYCKRHGINKPSPLGFNTSIQHENQESSESGGNKQPAHRLQ